MASYLAKVTPAMLAEMKRLVQQVFEPPTYEKGKRRARGLIVRFELRRL
ncbi:MAG: hypothetical protein HY330_03710 [Chloroflexi bacterium]|nr:hypothetical protein [Chloroflexota bacterium]